MDRRESNVNVTYCEGIATEIKHCLCLLSLAAGAFTGRGLDRTPCFLETVGPLAGAAWTANPDSAMMAAGTEDFPVELAHSTTATTTEPSTARARNAPEDKNIHSTTAVINPRPPNNHQTTRKHKHHDKARHHPRPAHKDTHHDHGPNPNQPSSEQRSAYRKQAATAAAAAGAMEAWRFAAKRRTRRRGHLVTAAPGDNQGDGAGGTTTAAIKDDTSSRARLRGWLRIG
ncbi:hypothetical protein F4861DRAFT_538874 [Xylaria intraflava]|nr:hypothetical protein F4861DRAFT_538874 [Xylaria intraflava]